MGALCDNKKMKKKTTTYEPRQKPIFFAMSLGCAYAGACALLTRAQFKLTRQHWETTSLRGAYAPGNVEKMIPHHRFCLRQPLFSAKRNTSWRLCPWACLHQRQRGNVLQKNQTQFQRLGFFRPLQVRKGFCLGRHVGARKVNTSLRGISPWRPWCCLTMTIMEKIKNLRENAEGNHSWGNHWSKPDDYMLWSWKCCASWCLMSWFPYISKSPSETKPQLESLLWPAHTTHVLTHSAYAAHS